jgi:hypothetical protein
MLWRKYRGVWRKYRGVWRKLEKSGENCKSGGEKKLIHACHDDDCNTCKVIKATVTQPLLQSYLSSKDAEAKKLPVVCVTADSGKTVGGFARDVLHVKHFKCFNHITGNMYLSLLIISIIAANDVFCLVVSPVSSRSTGTSLNLRWCTTSSTRGSPVQLSTHSHKLRRQCKMQCLST